jgi:hypothetical protein
MVQQQPVLGQEGQVLEIDQKDKYVLLITCRIMQLVPNFVKGVDLLVILPGTVGKHGRRLGLGLVKVSRFKEKS